MPIARWALGLGLLGAALLAGYIGGGDVLSAVTGDDRDSPGLVLVTVGAGFLLVGGVLAALALISIRARAGTPAALLVPLAGVPWWEALGPAGGLINAAFLIAAVALARALSASSRPGRPR